MTKEEKIDSMKQALVTVDIQYTYIRDAQNKLAFAAQSCLCIRNILSGMIEEETKDEESGKISSE